MNLIFFQTTQMSAVELFGFISSAVTAVAIIAGVVWFVFRGKNIEQLKQNVAQWKDYGESQRAKNQAMQTDISDLKTEIAELKSEVVRLERKVERMEEREEEIRREKEELKKDNLRLKAIVGEK